MLNIQNLTLAYGSNILLKSATVQLYKGQRVGVIGQNGAGKTSLFKLILGKLSAEAGDCLITQNTTISYVEQEITDLSAPLVEYVLSIHPLIIENLDYLPEYYQLRPQAEKLLVDLGFQQDELYRPVAHFSGGWQMRANLAKALFIPSDLLLLDEPTNHLDLETVIWLEDWLKQYQGLALIISHDREFLDNTTTHTLAVSGKTLTLYTGNYSTFEKTRYQQLQQQQQIMAKTQAKIAHLQSFVDRFRAKATKAKQAQSRVKMIEKLEVAQAMPKDIEYSIEFLEPVYQVDKLLSINNGTVGYTDNTLLNNVRLDIFQNSRIGLLGKNGIGKSTFIKALIDQSTLLSGECHVDNKIKVGYFAQHTVEQLSLDDTPLSLFVREHRDKKESEIRAYLGRYGFNGDKVKELIGSFSGGEKARLTIANIILHRPNIIFLDEPTNHLDMQMREELATSIQDFMGAVVIVSHDKFLLQSVVDEFYLLNDLHLNKFTGNLDDYHQWLLEHSTTKTSTKKPSQQKNKTRTVVQNDGNNDTTSQAISDNKKSAAKMNPKKRQSEIGKLDAKIDELAAKIKIIESELANLDHTQMDEMQTLLADYEKHKQKLAILEDKWLMLQD